MNPLKTQRVFSFKKPLFSCTLVSTSAAKTELYTLGFLWYNRSSNVGNLTHKDYVMALVLTRKSGEKVRVEHKGEELVMTVNIAGNRAKLVFEASNDFRIIREELPPEIPLTNEELLKR